MKRIIITGAAGLMGLNLATTLDNSKYEIIAIDKNKHNLQIMREINPIIKTVHADVSAVDNKWENYFKQAYCVIQLQAQISAPTMGPYIKNNVTSVKNIVKICEKYKIKNLIHLSSSVVISVADDDYTNTKKTGEEIVRKSKANYTIIRPPLMYGYFDAKHLGYMTMLIDKFPIFPIPGNGKYIRQPLYVRDLIKIVIKLIEMKPKRKIYDIIGKEKIYFIDIIRILAKARKKHRLIVTIPIPLFVFMLKAYSLLTNKRPFNAAQLKALKAGDIFPITNWEKEFKVKYTPFRQGVQDMLRSKYYKYRDKMQI